MVISFNVIASFDPLTKIGEPTQPSITKFYINIYVLDCNIRQLPIKAVFFIQYSSLIVTFAFSG
jgi:hypothetical protein